MAMGKKEANTTVARRAAELYPNQMVSSGRMATIGIAYSPLTYSFSRRSTTLMRPMARPMSVPERTAMSRPSTTARSVTAVACSIPALASACGRARAMLLGRAT